MRIAFYCQYVWGMGHLFRSVELVRALAGHQVTLIAGGQEVDIDLPAHVSLLRLPTLCMNEEFTTLIAGHSDQSLAEIQRQRKAILFNLFEKQRPDLFIVELYPFGRTIFGFELEPLLQAIRQGRFGHVKSVCSLRDILVEKRDPRTYEERVLDHLKRYFDLLLIHSDEALLPLNETFGRVNEIPIPLYYTGFISQRGDPQNGKRLRHELALDDGQKLIVASAGGGRSGFRPLASVMKACDLLRDSVNIRAEVFAGPFMDDSEVAHLSGLSTESIALRRFTRRFLDYLYAADLSISLAGYNTCMNLLETRVPALVYPHHRQQEQPLRVGKLKQHLPMRILQDDDLQPTILRRHIEQMLLHPPEINPLQLNLDGAQNSARYLNNWMGCATA